MICPSCQQDVDAGQGYCPACGANLNVRLCPNGHVMDPSWAVCQYCPPGAAGMGAGMAMGGLKGRTVIEPGGGMGMPGMGMGMGDIPRGPTQVHKKMTVVESKTGGPQARIVGWIISFTWNKSGQDFQVREGKNVIGSDPSSCDVCLREDEQISGKHATLIYRGERFLLGDEHSMNGTFVNGKDISEVNLQEIKDNDLIRMGKTEFKLKVL